MIGKTISHYEILEKLGEGGMGVVYKAHDTKLDRTVALKFLPPHLTATAEDKERFVREAKAAAALNHPNICTIHNVDEFDGNQFIVMEYVDGVTLRDKLEIGNQKLETPATDNRKLTTAIDYAIQIAEALQQAHRKDIVHRDIKPENIMVTEDNRIKVMDFGLAKLKGAANITAAGGTVGTIGYMSPEQIQGENIDQRSDIFSFGVVLYELLTGRLPFAGEHQAALVYSIVNQEPDPIPKYIPDASTDLIFLVSRLLEKDPAKRYQTMIEVLTQIRVVKSKLAHRLLSHSNSASRTDDTAGSVFQRLRNNVKFIIPSTILLLIIVFYLFKTERGEDGNITPRERISIAVLPLENLSPDPENEYFTDGITEDIIIQLSKISDLRVMSRSSMMRYKGSNLTLREIGDELGVTTILEGSVRRVGNRVRINSQLIDIRSNESLWGETYDRTIDDIFAIQTDVATQIASALQITISPDERRSIERQPTGNLDAYDFYLRGRESYSRYRREHNESAIEFFKKAIEKDPDFSLAYAGLGDAYGQRVIRFNYSRDWVDSAIAASEKAIHLDPAAAEGYKALGLAHLAKGKFQKALEANIKAIELNPNQDIAFNNVGLIFLHRGEFDKAAFYFQKSFELRTPTDPWPYYSSGILYLYLDSPEITERYLQQALHYSPDFSSPRIALSVYYTLYGRIENAREESEFVLHLDPDNSSLNSLRAYIELLDNNYETALEYYEKTDKPFSGRIEMGTMKFPTPGVSYIYKKRGDVVNFREQVQRKIHDAQNEMEAENEHYIYPYELAASYAMLGETEKVYTYLEQAIANGWRHYRYAMVDPSFEEIRDADRFRRIMDNLKTMVQSESISLPTITIR
jgi:serine/threonine protein kinase/tetratricopeptide (TPR) repeat protein